jgi:hypothetical protein
VGLLAGLAVALVAAVVLATLWLSRTSTLSNRVGSFHCALSDDPTGPWHGGVAEYGRVRMYWWRLRSIAPRAAAVWDRRGIVVLERRLLPEGAEPTAVVVRCRVGSAGPAQVWLRMSPDAYSGFTSWLEATPTTVGAVI